MQSLPDGRDLDRAAFGAAVPVVVFGVPDRDLPPWQPFELVIQRRRVLLDDQDEVGALLGDQEAGMVALGVQGVTVPTRSSAGVR